jgi:signal transduction histidine kinase
MLPVETPDELSIVAASGLPTAITTTARVRLGEPVSGLVAKTRQPLLVNEAVPTQVRSSSCRTGSFISVPVRLDDRACGVLNVADPVAEQRFREDDMLTLQSFADLVARDIALARQHLELPRLQQAVRQLRREIIHAREDERRRIARELHDEAGNALTAAIFHIDLESIKLPPEADAARDVLSTTRARLMECSATLHNIAYSLRPRVLEDLGLGPALQSLVDQTRELGKIDADLLITGPATRLSEMIDLTIFRVVQEALTNVLKHAQARHTWVHLDYQPRTLCITIEDDGIGAAAPRRVARRGSGLGLAGMRERIEMLDGILHIGPRQPRGTRIIAELPVQPRSSDSVDYQQDPRPAN